MATVFTVIVALFNIDMLIAYTGMTTPYIIYIILCALTYFGTLLIGKIAEWMAG